MSAVLGDVGATKAVLATKETALLAAHKSAGAVVMGAELASAQVENIASYLGSGLCLNKERCKAMILHTTYETRKGVLSGFKDLIKTSLTEDPNMCDAIRKVVERSIDMVWAEVEDELERDLEAAVLNQLANEDIKGPLAQEPWMEWYWRFRRFLLSHYFPHNKSIFGKLRDPVYVSILLLSLAPLCGVRFTIFSVVLIMLWTPGPPDEYMLLNFIMIFKGFQFISNGVIKTAWATTVYFYCISSSEVPDVRHCALSHGPTSVLWISLAIDYIGNVLLTWLAWYSIGHSANYGQNRFLVDRGRLDPSIVEDDSPVRSSSWAPSVNRHGRANRRKGGLFHMLMCYDSCCFTFSFILLVVMTYNMCGSATSFSELAGDPQFTMNIFWVNVIFSVTTLPFLPLNIPWLFSVFTRSTPTGFNRQGACVAFRIAVVDMRKRKSMRPTITGAWQTVKDIKEFGRSRRQQMSGIADGEEAPAPGYTDAAYDFSYGLYRAVLYSEMDSQEAADVPTDSVTAPDQLMMVWDRF